MSPELILFAFTCLSLGVASGIYLGKLRLERSLKRHFEDLDSGSHS